MRQAIDKLDTANKANDLAQASSAPAKEFFDIYEEPTDKGGIRLLYRIKPDLRF